MCQMWLNLNMSVVSDSAVSLEVLTSVCGKIRMDIAVVLLTEILGCHLKSL